MVVTNIKRNGRSANYCKVKDTNIQCSQSYSQKIRESSFLSFVLFSSFQFYLTYYICIITVIIFFIMLWTCDCGSFHKLLIPILVFNKNCCNFLYFVLNLNFEQQEQKELMLTFISNKLNIYLQLYQNFSFKENFLPLLRCQLFQIKYITSYFRSKWFNVLNLNRKFSVVSWWVIFKD